MPATSPTDRLSDPPWEQLQDLLPRNGNPGGQGNDHRALFDGILGPLSDGGRWRHVPDRFGPGQSVDGRFRRWVRSGRWDRIPLRRQARPLVGGAADLELSCLGGSVVRAHPSAAGAPNEQAPAGEPADHGLGRDLGGFRTEPHLVRDGRGVPLAVALGPGQQHETQPFEALLEEVAAWPVLPERLAGDKGYSAGWVRDWLKEHGIQDVIPAKKNEARDKKFDKQRYWWRSIVQRCLGSLTWSRRVATRYEKLATPYLAMAELAIIFRLLELEPPDTTAQGQTRSFPVPGGRES